MLGGNARGLTSPCCCLRSSRLRPKKREKSDDDSERRHEAREREVDDAHGRLFPRRQRRGAAQGYTEWERRRDRARAGLTAQGHSLPGLQVLRSSDICVFYSCPVTCSVPRTVYSMYGTSNLGTYTYLPLYRGGTVLSFFFRESVTTAPPLHDFYILPFLLDSYLPPLYRGGGALVLL